MCKQDIIHKTEVHNAANRRLSHDYRYTHVYTHTHTFNGPLSGTTRVSRYQKGKTNLDFTEARDSEWQWHQLGLMQVCTSLQTDNHASIPPLMTIGNIHKKIGEDWLCSSRDMFKI